MSQVSKWGKFYFTAMTLHMLWIQLCMNTHLHTLITYTPGSLTKALVCIISMAIIIAQEQTSPVNPILRKSGIAQYFKVYYFQTQQQTAKATCVCRVNITHQCSIFIVQWYRVDILPSWHSRLQIWFSIWCFAWLLKYVTSMSTCCCK